MNTSDIIAVFALLTSGVSLFLTLKSANFSKRTKFAELRASVMSKAVEVSNNFFEVREFFANAQKKAEELNDVAMYKNFDLAMIDKLHAKMETTRQGLNNMPNDKALDIYELIYHDLEDVNQQITALDKKSRQQYEKTLVESTMK